MLTHLLRKLKRPINGMLGSVGLELVRAQPKEEIPSGAKQQTPTRLIVGGGDYDYGPEWHNLDYVTVGYSDKYSRLEKNVDIPYDLNSYAPLPLDDGSLEAAYTSHVIEHIKDRSVQYLFDEMYRCLMPGGYFRVSCPDIDLYLRAFYAKDLEFFHYRGHPHYAALDISQSVSGMFLDVFCTKVADKRYSYEQVHDALTTMGEEAGLDHFCEQVGYDPAFSHYHVNWFNQAKLTRMLQQAGFSNIYRSALGQSRYHRMRNLRFFDTGDPKISLFIECQK